MKCPRCDGKRCEPDNSGSLVWRACKKCHGTGIVPDDNEHWFCFLPTEEKANIFGNMLFEAWKDGLAEEMHDKYFYEDLVESWLKAEHRKE